MKLIAVDTVDAFFICGHIFPMRLIAVDTVAALVYRDTDFTDFHETDSC